MTILCDSMAKYMSGIRNTVVQSFPGINISQMKHVITSKQASLPEIAQYSPYYLPLNVLLLPKDHTCVFYLVLSINILFFWLVRIISRLHARLTRL